MKRLITDLDDIPWIAHGFFTRQGGVSGGIYGSLNCGLKTDDSADNVAVNRARVEEAIGAPLVIARQVHGDKVATVTKAWTQEQAPQADALVTAKPGLALGILTADCAPVLFADRKNKIIGAAHAGWRGAVGGILEATVAAMQKLGSNPENISAAIGPCIGPASYEVKDDFTAPFIAQDEDNLRFFTPGKRIGHLMFDIPGYVAHRLSRCGIGKVYDTKQDTCALDSVFFSNRRALLRGENGFGLQLSVISMDFKE